MALFALLVLISLAVLASVFGSSPTPPFIKDTEVYKQAFARLNVSKAVLNALGSPLDGGSFFKGSIEDGEKTGLAKFSVFVRGPKGGASLTVDAVKADGVWRFGLLELSPKGQASPLNLLLEPELK